MSGEHIFGVITMLLCGWGCGAIFYGIGVWAGKRKEPMHFWSGSVVDAKTITDIPAYNRANGRMWKGYSIPFWLTGLTGIVSIFDIRLSILSAVFIGLACTVGIGWLLWKYKMICKKYMDR